MAQLLADEIMRLQVKIAPPELVGPVADGKLQVIPITGGTFAGEKLNGRVVPGGADWNTGRPEGLAHVFAKYLLQTEDGEYIAIENEGVIDFAAGTLIKTRPTFQANQNGRYGFLNEGVYVGSLEVDPQTGNQVNITIYKLR